MGKKAAVAKVAAVKKAEKAAAKCKAKAKADSKPKAKPRRVEEAPATLHEPWDFDSFAKDVLAQVQDVQPVSPSEKPEILRWASGCDGLNTPSSILNELKVPHIQLFGAECNKAAAWFSLSKFDPQHLFQDRC